MLFSVTFNPINSDYRLGDRRAHIQRVCGDAVFQKCKLIWGLNKEGEINGAWRDIGIRGLWYMIGALKVFPCGWSS
jgi:hypothetical protein